MRDLSQGKHNAIGHHLSGLSIGLFAIPTQACIYSCGVDLSYGSELITGIRKCSCTEIWGVGVHAVKLQQDSWTITLATES